jgi:hypothetical protein
LPLVLLLSNTPAQASSASPGSLPKLGKGHVTKRTILNSVNKIL